LKIRARHRQAIELLASGVAIGECADQVGVSSRSIFNWLDDDEFKRLLKARESEIIERLNTRLIMASEKALTVLLDGLESRDERIRIRSASIINSSFLKAIEVHDLYDHIDRINEKIDRLALRR